MGSQHSRRQDDHRDGQNQQKRERGVTGEDGIRRPRENNAEKGERTVVVRHMVGVRRKEKADRQKGGDYSGYRFQGSRSHPALLFIPHHGSPFVCIHFSIKRAFGRFILKWYF